MQAKRNRFFVFNKINKLVASFRFRWVAILAAALVGGEIRLTRNLRGKSARCRISAGRKFTRCQIVRVNAKRMWVRLPDGNVISRRNSWVVA